MTIEKRQEVFDQLFEECKEIVYSKGTEYAGGEDTLSNFKRNAERLGLSKYDVWAVYFAKHVDSIFSAIKEGGDVPKVRSEPLRERIKDVLVYAALLECLYEEDQNVVNEDVDVGLW